MPAGLQHATPWVSVSSCRLRDEATQHSSRLEAQLAATARAAAEESERQKAAERVLQQRLQDVAAELAVAQVGKNTVYCLEQLNRRRTTLDKQHPLCWLW